MIGWIPIIAFAAILAALFVWLLIYCLRMGVVGGGKSPWAGNARREEQPIRYWTGIGALAPAAAAMMYSLVQAVSFAIR